MKQRNLKLWAIAILVVCLVTSLALTACHVDDGEPTYYLSVGGETYSSASSVPSGVKFTKSDDVYTLTAELEQGKTFTINLVGSDEKIGYKALFSTAGKITEGTGNSMVVAESGKFAFTLDVSDDEPLLTYSFTDEQTIIPEVTVSKVEITTSVAELTVGGVSAFVATVTFSDASTDTTGLSWSSSNENVATVEGGIVRALEVGSTEITASKGGKSDTVTLQVTKVGVTLNKHEITLQPNETEKLEATLSGLTSGLLWESLNESVATVDTDGKVTAVGYGVATVRVSTAIGGYTDECTVTVQQPVKSISLSSSSVTMYGVGATRTISVVFNPSDATNQEFAVSVDVDGIISYEKEGTSITLTALAEGSATLLVTSKENSNLTATCNITVSTGDAEPTLSYDEIVLTDIGSESDNIEVLLDGGEITSFTATANASIISVKKSTNSFTVTSNGFGSTTVTVTVNYGNSQSVQLTLKVRVVSKYFYLVGPVGSGSSWETKGSEAEARQANVLLEEVSDGIYELTRDFVGGNNFYILPAVLVGNTWPEAGLPVSYYVAQSNASTYKISSNNDNVILNLSGNYTVRLDLTGSKASWTVIVNSVSISKATLSTTADSIKNRETATLTLKIEPSVVTVPASSIEWSIKESAYESWVTLSASGDAMSASLKLSDQFAGTSVNVTVVVTITIDGKVVATAEQIIALLGSEIIDVTEVTFDDEAAVILYDVSEQTPGSWTFPVTAHVNSDASIQTITYSIKEGNIYSNSDIQWAFSIDGNGTVTALMFGTFTVVATSNGTNSEGKTVSAEKTVRVYSTAFYVSVGWADLGSSKANESTTEDYVTFTWTNIKVPSANAPVVLLYEGIGDADWKYAIRSGSYLDSVSPSGVVTSKTGSSSGCFNVVTVGMYSITLDLSGTMPKVSFTRTGDIVASDTWTATSKKVSVVGASNTWNGADDGTNVFYTVEEQTITNDNPYVFVTYNFSAAKFNSVGNGAYCALTVADNWYMGSYYGDKVSTSATSGKWYHQTSSGNLTAQGFAVYNTTWTFIVKFDEEANVLGVQIESGTITSADGFTDKIGD